MFYFPLHKCAHKLMIIIDYLSIVTPLQPTVVSVMAKPSASNFLEILEIVSGSISGGNRMYAYPPPPAPVNFAANP